MHLISAVETLPGLSGFDANERALFEALVLRWSQGQPMTVREAIGLSELGSPATLHKRLKRVIARDLLVAYHEGANRRTKFLKPSDKGMDYIGWMSEQVAQVQTH